MKSTTKRTRVSRERGQALVLGLIFSLGLALAALSVANIGIMSAERVKTQNVADAAALSAATVQARYMNLTAYVNRAMIANYNSIAFNLALQSTVDSFDHGGAMVAGLLYALATLMTPTGPFAEGISAAGQSIDHGFHTPMHMFNKVLKYMFGPGIIDVNFNGLIERYNTDILSMYQGILYAGAQSLRAEVAEAVGRRSDPYIETKTVLSLGAENENFEDLKYSTNYALSNSGRGRHSLAELSEYFSKIMGPDPSGEAPLLLGALTESSLDKFSAGYNRKGKQDTLRNFNSNNIIPQKALLKAWLDEMKAACFVARGFHTWHCDSHFKAYVGGEQRWGYEDKLKADRVPIVDKNRVRQVNYFGADMQLKVRYSKHKWFDFAKLVGGGGGTAGHNENSGEFTEGYTSGDENNDLQSMKNLLSENKERKDACLPSWSGWLAKFKGLAAYPSCFKPIASSCTLGHLNACIAEAFYALPVETSHTMDVHWDGNFSPAARGPDLIWGAGEGELQTARYQQRVWGPPHPPNLSKGVPSYQFKTPLNQVGFGNYTRRYYEIASEKRGDNNVRKQSYFEGPSVMVVATKKAQDIKMLKAPLIANPYDIVTYSRAQVYYKGNPNRTKEKASTFNPYWGMRLAPVKHMDSIRGKVIPYLAARGVPIDAAH